MAQFNPNGTLVSALAAASMEYAPFYLCYTYRSATVLEAMKLGLRPVMPCVIETFVLSYPSR